MYSCSKLYLEVPLLPFSVNSEIALGLSQPSGASVSTLAESAELKYFAQLPRIFAQCSFTSFRRKNALPEHVFMGHSRIALIGNPIIPV